MLLFCKGGTAGAIKGNQALSIRTTPSPAPYGCRVKRRMAAATRAQDAALDRLDALDEVVERGWTDFLESFGLFDTTPNSCSWVGWGVDGLEHVVRMLNAAAASDTIPPAADPQAAAAAAADGAGSSIVQQGLHRLQPQQGLQPATRADPAAAAAAGSPSPHQQRMMDMLVPVVLQPWHWHELKESGSSYSGAFAMRPLHEWLAMHGHHFGSGLMEAIIHRFG